MSLKPNQDSVFNFPHSLSLPDADSFFFFLIYLFLIGEEMLYNVMFVSAMYQHEPLKIYIFPHPVKPPSHLPPHPTPLGCHKARG